MKTGIVKKLFSGLLFMAMIAGLLQWIPLNAYAASDDTVTIYTNDEELLYGMYYTDASDQSQSVQVKSGQSFQFPSGINAKTDPIDGSYRLNLSTFMIGTLDRVDVTVKNASGTVIDHYETKDHSFQLKPNGNRIEIRVYCVGSYSDVTVSYGDELNSWSDARHSSFNAVAHILRQQNRIKIIESKTTANGDETLYEMIDDNGTAHRYLFIYNANAGATYKILSNNSGVVSVNATTAAGNSYGGKITFAGGKSGWKQDGNRWWYQYANGGYPINKWEQIDRKWYHFDASGYMQTGWKSLDGKWYYLGGDGAMRTGWKQVGRSWYYFAGDGAMRAGWQKVGGIWYYFAVDGAMRAGWQRVSGIWYYFGGDGAMRTGWQKLSGSWYYFGSDGMMLSNTTRSIDGKTYRFDANGVCTNP